MDWSFLIEKQFLKGSLLCDWGSGEQRAETSIHCSLPDPSSSGGIKWIERTRVSDGTPLPERHSICYEVGVLMKCGELLFLFFPPFSHPSLPSRYKAGLQSASHEMDGRSRLNFTLLWSWLMCLVWSVTGSGTALPLAGAQTPPSLIT